MKDFKNNNMIGARTLDIVIMMDAKHCGCCYGVMIWLLDLVEEQMVPESKLVSVLHKYWCGAWQQYGSC